MIRKLIEIEERKYHEKGYDTVVSLEEETVYDCIHLMSLGNDTIIITGVLFDSDAVCGGANPKISIVSPSDTICASVSSVVSLGENIYKVMRDYMIIKRYMGGNLDDSQLPLSLRFVRISPKNK